MGIFPEGHITKDGELLPFRPGIARILNDRPVPVIPSALGGMWGSFFSKIAGKAMTRPFRRGLFNQIEFTVAPAVPPHEAAPEVLQAKVRELRGDRR